VRPGSQARPEATRRLSSVRRSLTVYVASHQVDRIAVEAAMSVVEDQHQQAARAKRAPSARATRRTKLVSRAEAYAYGKKLREACPRELHARWKARRGRADAVQLVLEAEKGRMRELLPLRHGRMARSAFTFYRGAALTMASDLAPTPVTGLRVQCCGDAHLSNFGGFATP